MEHSLPNADAHLTAGARAFPDLAEIKLNSPAVAQDAFPIYAALREAGGVLWSRRHKAWIVSSYDHVRAVLLHPAASVETFAPVAARGTPHHKETIDTIGRVTAHWIPFNDPPVHTRLRKALQRGFMPSSIASHEPMIRAITQSVLDRIADRPEIEFLDDVAFQIPALVITELYNLPRGEVDRIKRWSAGIAELVLGSTNPDRYETTAGMMREMEEFFRAHIAERAAAIASGAVSGGESLLDLLLAARNTPDGLTHDEIASTLILILFAAPETTANLILNAMLNLALHPEVLDSIRADPSLIPGAIEELLRYDGPVPAVVRVAKGDIALGETTIRSGDRIFLLLKSANRDESCVPAADELRLGRGRFQHLGFGTGLHLCIGAPLARLEAKVAFEEILKRFHAFEIRESDIRWRDELLAHSPRSLRIAMRPRAAA
ncbi:cytochrome P450 [Enterovirga sp. CN4-39]|uniref:cytochrome P450 n=1 Tax=Enterovirga sp. CN4-39 TaxID=3400910 RepID=UPI003C124514